jgi:hypothetical protein
MIKSSDRNNLKAGTYKKIMVYFFFPSFVIWISFSAQPVMGQNNPGCEVIKALENGSYVVIINSDTMIAITSQAAANSLVLSGEVDRLRKRIALCEGLFDDYDSTMAQYDVVLSGKNEYISGLELVCGRV